MEFSSSNVYVFSMKTFCLFLLGIEILFVNVCCDRNFTNLIKDFLVQQREPTKLTAILCWTQVEKIQLSRKLQQSYLQVSFPSFNSEALFYPSPEEHQLFLTDLSCGGVQAVLTKADQLSLFRHPFRWLVIRSNKTSSNADFLGNLAITVDTRFFVADTRDSLTYDIEAIYKVTKNSEFLSNNVSKWTKGSGFAYFNELIISRNRSNLMGTVLNVSYVVPHLETLNHLWDYIDPHIDSVTKINYVFVQYLLDVMNARDSFKMHQIWGFKNSSMMYYTGMIGDLQTGVAEIGGTAAFITKDRIPLIEYVASTAPIKIKFIFKEPPLSYVANIFTLPFDHLVWASCIALIMLTALALNVIVNWEQKKIKYLPREHRDDMDVTRLNPNFVDALMVEIGGACQQGYDDEPKSPAGRIVLIFSFVAFIFLYTSYSANIVALLQTTSNNIKTLEDLLKSRIQLGVDDQSYNRQYFAAETDPIRKAIYQEKVVPRGQPSNFMTIENGIAKVRNDFFAFNVELGSAYKTISETFMEHEKCGLMEIQYLQVNEPFMAIKKNSSYSEIIKVGFKKIRESGIQSREVSQFFHKKPPCSSKGNNFMSVGLTECYYGFLIFGIGIGCAVVILILENISSKYQMKK